VLKKSHKEGQKYLRRDWKIDKKHKNNPNKGYIPSHKREGFDESKVIKL